MTTTTIQGLTVFAQGELEIVMTRAFKAPAQLVFDAWTKPEHVRRWFGASDWTLDVCDIDLRPGGKYRFHMRKDEGAQNKYDGEQMGLYGEYREIDAPVRLTCTELFEEPYFEEMGAGTINTLTFDEARGTTTNVAVTLYKTREARDAVLNGGMASGAAESFTRMEELLAELQR